MLVAPSGIALLIFLCSFGTCYGDYQCPSFCKCRSSIIIECDGENIAERDITKLFTDLPKECVLFSLSKSNITTINTRLFSRVLPALKELKLDSNRLVEVPQNLSGVFPALERLQLTANQITSVGRYDFAGLRELVTLRLDENRLLEIRPHAFRSNKNLESLFLESNLIENISVDAFKGIDQLTNLMLNNNRLKTLPKGLFKGFQNTFMQINVADNQIEHIPKGLFAVNQAYVFFDLSNNTISTINEDAFQYISIGVLNLRNNALASLSPNMFHNLTFKSINLMDNPLNCDCKTAKILRYLELENRLEKRQMISGVCDSPGVVKGIFLRDLIKDDVTEQLNCTVCDFNNACANNGKCFVIKDQMMCECLPGYAGETCENVVPASTSPEAEEEDKDEEGGLNTTTYILVSGILLIVLVILAVVVCCRRRRRRTNDTMSKNELLEEEKTSEERCI